MLALSRCGQGECAGPAYTGAEQERAADAAARDCEAAEEKKVARVEEVLRGVWDEWDDDDVAAQQRNETEAKEDRELLGYEKMNPSNGEGRRTPTPPPDVENEVPEVEYDSDGSIHNVVGDEPWVLEQGEMEKYDPTSCPSFKWAPGGEKTGDLVRVPGAWKTLKHGAYIVVGTEEHDPNVFFKPLCVGDKGHRPGINKDKPRHVGRWEFARVERTPQGAARFKLTLSGDYMPGELDDVQWMKWTRYKTEADRRPRDPDSLPAQRPPPKKSEAAAGSALKRHVLWPETSQESIRAEVQGQLGAAAAEPLTGSSRAAARRARQQRMGSSEQVAALAGGSLAGSAMISNTNEARLRPSAKNGGAPNAGLGRFLASEQSTPAACTAFASERRTVPACSSSRGVRAL